MQQSWDEIVTDACQSVSRMLDDHQYQYYYGVTDVAHIPRLREIIEDAILQATVCIKSADSKQ
ncbi:hypothetical protein ASF69_01535 [Rhizobium sp. Leaf311]|nr:hypothetical protein ASF69_01535 [Rhizobium sp. Leaf311]